MSHSCFDGYYTVLSWIFFVSRYDLYKMGIIKFLCDLIYKNIFIYCHFTHINSRNNDHLGEQLPVCYSGKDNIYWATIMCDVSWYIPQVERDKLPISTFQGFIVKRTNY